MRTSTRVRRRGRSLAGAGKNEDELVVPGPAASVPDVGADTATFTLDT
ncbi:hypothetical protein [Nocardia sp. Marseille-Q1738]